MRPFGFASPHGKKDRVGFPTDFPAWIRSPRPRSGGLIGYGSTVKWAAKTVSGLRFLTLLTANEMTRSKP